MLESLAALKALGPILQRVSKHYEYWKEYKEKRILIRNSTFESGVGDHSMTRRVTHVIEGTIDDVMSNPPGFMLVDVEERVERVESKGVGPGNMGESDGILHGHNNVTDVRSIDRKFISFDAIDELELADDAVNADDKPGLPSEK